jgi:small subunit ribosomal protein S6
LTAYEILLMLDPELPEERQSEIITRTRELIERGGGTWRSHDLWGRRRLAYEIGHKGEGVYHLFVFDATAETLAEVTRVLKITDGVIRLLAVRHIEGSQTRAPRDEPVAVPERDYGAASVRSHEAQHESAPESLEELPSEEPSAEPQVEPQEEE